MKNKLIESFERRTLAKAKSLPKFRAGDTVRIHYKVQEGSDKTKFRVQPFEGLVVRFRRGSTEASFTVRKIGANGVGVERIFPLYSPYIDQIDVISSGFVRRSRLYYLRDLAGKAARIRSRAGGRRGMIAVPGAEQQPVDMATVELAQVAEEAPKTPAKSE